MIRIFRRRSTSGRAALTNDVNRKFWKIQMRMLLTGTILVVSLSASVAFGQAPFVGGNATKGKAFALGTCTPCHVVAHGQRSPERFSPERSADAPSFSAIANTKGMTATSLAAFLSSPHPTMPNLILSADEQRDVISYILGLGRKR